MNVEETTPNENPEIAPDSRIGTREARIAQREAQPLRRFRRMFANFFPLLLLTGVTAGTLNTFYRRETVRTLGGDIAIGACFVVILLVMVYLNPQVQQFVQLRGDR